MDDARLEALRSGNQAARSLPLLAAIARRRGTLVRLEYLEDQQLVDPGHAMLSISKADSLPIDSASGRDVPVGYGRAVG